jgi:hypothetical protein
VVSVGLLLLGYTLSLFDRMRTTNVIGVLVGAMALNGWAQERMRRRVSPDTLVDSKLPST